MHSPELFPIEYPEGSAMVFKPNIKPNSPDAPACHKSSYPSTPGRFIIPHAKINPRQVCFYNEYYGFPRNRYRLSDLKHNKQLGLISYNAKKRINKAIDWLVYLSKYKKVYSPKLEKTLYFKLAFITLSLPCPQIKYYVSPSGAKLQMSDYSDYHELVNNGIGEYEMFYSDKFIKENLLQQFLNELRNKYKCNLYLWRAETQMNGNIHFHISHDKYIFYEDLRHMWNRILNKTDMISRYSSKFSKMSFEEYKKMYLRSSGLKLKELKKRFDTQCRNSWSDPNTTDIHSVRNLKNLGGYLAKYIAKSDPTRRHVDGNLWRCSELLSKFDALDVIVSSDEGFEIQYLYNKFPTLVYNKDFCHLLKVSIYSIEKYLKNSKVISRFNSYINSILLESRLEPFIPAC